MGGQIEELVYIVLVRESQVLVSVASLDNGRLIVPKAGDEILFPPLCGVFYDSPNIFSAAQIEFYNNINNNN